MVWINNSLEMFKTQAEFEKWLGEMESTLEQFKKIVPPNVSEYLDFSFDSATILETWLLERYHDYHEITVPQEWAFWDGSARYVGETLRKRLGGHWETVLDRRKNVSFRLPRLNGFSAKSTPETPHYLITAAIARHQPGYIRKVLDGTVLVESKWE